MTVISLIAAVDEQYGLGKNNQLLCHLPADLQYFKNQTRNKPIIMGRKTFESIGRPLPDRVNIVLSTTLPNQDGIQIVDSLDQAFNLFKDAEEIMVIGGAQIFAETLPLAQKIYLTHIYHHFDADVFFPEPDWTEWNKSSSTFREKDEKNRFDLMFSVYERICKRSGNGVNLSHFTSSRA